MLDRYSFRANVDHEKENNVSTMTIPKDVFPPAFEVQNDKAFDLEFTKPGTVHHTDRNHFNPALPKGSVVAHKTTHTPHKEAKGKVRIDFTFDTGREVTAHTILIGD
jgi:hypothetical protein